MLFSKKNITIFFNVLISITFSLILKISNNLIHKKYYIFAKQYCIFKIYHK